MNEDKKPLLSELSSANAYLVEIILTAVAISFATNLLSGLIQTKLNSWALLTVSAFLLLVAVGYITHLRIGRRKATKKIHAVFVTKRDKGRTKSKDIVNIRGYDFNREISQILNSLFTENSAMKDQWINNPLTIDNEERKKDIPLVVTGSQQLVIEIVEYMVLERLSTHLTDYFDKGFEKEPLDELTREDLSELITSNRVLDAISKDMKDRPAFKKYVKDQARKQNNSGEVIYVWSNGAMYSKFELTLPKGSKIYRSKSGVITIENQSLMLSFEPHFEGYNSLIDPYFERRYMKQKQPFGIDAWAVDISITIKIKSRLMTHKTLKYHKWADSFLRSITLDYDFKRFLKDIEWQTAKTILIATDEQRKPSSKAKKKNDKKSLLAFSVQRLEGAEEEKAADKA